MKYPLLLVMLDWSNTQVATAFAAPRRLEAAAVKRFREFEKLCKTCPTTLKPRVETLTEMILGLSDVERKELWNAVAQRLEDGPENVSGAQTPEDVFKFQTGVDAARKQTQEEPKPTIRKDSQSIVGESPQPSQKDTDEFGSKLLQKMNKTRSKLQDSKRKRARIQRLLDQTDSLLANNTTLPWNGVDETDSTLYHSMDELTQMSHTERKYQRLKYMAQKSKLDQKIAKYRLKLYGTSLELVNAAEQTKQELALIINE